MKFECKRCGRCCKYPCRFGSLRAENISKQLSRKKSIIILRRWNRFACEYVDRFTGVCAFFMGDRCAVFDPEMHNTGCEMSHGVQTNMEMGRWSDDPDSIEVVK